MTENIEIETFGYIPGESFELNEATSLINHEIVRIQDGKYLPFPPHEKVGFIVGVIWLNDEIELIIQIEEKLAQVTKSEFSENFLRVPEPKL